MTAKSRETDREKWHRQGINAGLEMAAKIAEEMRSTIVAWQIRKLKIESVERED